MNVRSEMVTLLKENTDGELFDTGLGDDYLDLTTRTKATKAKNKWNYINEETSAQQRKPSN